MQHRWQIAWHDGTIVFGIELLTYKVNKFKKQQRQQRLETTNDTEQILDIKKNTNEQKDVCLSAGFTIIDPRNMISKTSHYQGEILTPLIPRGS